MPNSTEASAKADPIPASPPILEVLDLRKEFRTESLPVEALRGVSLTVRPGEFVAIMGTSGSGKSTLLHLLGGLDKPTSGSIRIEGRELARLSDRQRTLFRRRRLGIVFQAYNLLPTLTALENVALPAMLEGAGDGSLDGRARELLTRVELGHRTNHRPQALSGGEQQRVAIARALINDPVVLLADEPTGNLDTENGIALWRLLASLVKEKGCTVITVTHEADGASFADRVLFLKDGRIVGEMEPGGVDHASDVAARYQELVG